MVDHETSSYEEQDGAVLSALHTLLELRRDQPETAADLANPFRQEWLAESAAGQDLIVARETQRLQDILCWAREDPALLLSATELAADLGRQLARLMTLALYLERLNGTSLGQFAASYASACGQEAARPR
jgi:hypothetical protein